MELSVWNISRFFVLSLKNGNNDSTRSSSFEYHMPLLEIKDFNISTDNKPICNQLIKNRQETYEKRVEMSRNNDSTTGSLLDYL